MPCDFDENLIKVTKYEVLGKLPDPFVMDDGSICDSAEKWSARRAEIYRHAVELQYGTQPPKPEFLTVERLYLGGDGHSDNYFIHTGTNVNPVVIEMKIFRPASAQPCPAVIDGDGCFDYYCDKEFIHGFTDNGIAFVSFNRTGLAHDVKGEERMESGQLYRTYPEYTFGALGAWAWGYSRCVDALELIGGFDMTMIAFTGHSRGGKTAMLAGVLDSRAAIVAPNETNAGSCSCYRIHMSALTEDGKEGRSETLRDITSRYGYWFGPELKDYAECEEKLPFDCHYLKAMIAPRILLVGEAASDIWTNPIGSWQTTMAAYEVYKMLGAEDNLYWYYRRGYHGHAIEDVRRLVGLILHVKYGDTLEDTFFKTPFVRPELIFDWRAPQK